MYHHDSNVDFRIFYFERGYDFIYSFCHRFNDFTRGAYFPPLSIFSKISFGFCFEGDYLMKTLSIFGKVIIGLGIVQIFLGIYFLIRELNEDSFGFFSQSTTFLGLGVIFISLAITWYKKLK